MSDSIDVPPEKSEQTPSTAQSSSSGAAGEATNIIGPCESNESGECDGKTLLEYVMYDYKLTMWIPGEFTGRVVGKKGVVITNLQRETRARHLSALTPVGDSLWVAVVIIGDWKCIGTAYKAISDIAQGEVDDVVLEFIINFRKPFFIYGKNKLAVIKLISAKSNVRIFLPETNPREPDFAQNVPMTLEGSFDGVKKAVALLEEEALSYREKHAEGAGKKILSKSVPFLVAPEKERKEKDKKEIVCAVSKEKKDSDSTPVSARDKESEKTEPMVKTSQSTQKSIKIPTKIVNILLSKGPGSKACPINQIQTYTNTSISRVTASENVRHQDAPDCESDSLDSGHFHDTIEAPPDVAMEDSTPAPSVGAKTSRDEVVVFHIVGSTENVDNAFNELQAILKGKRIRDVLEKFKNLSRAPPHRREDKDKERDRPSIRRFVDAVKSTNREKEKEREGNALPDREKEKKSRPLPAGPPAKEEKFADKDGNWRKEKLPEKHASVTSHDRSKRGGAPPGGSSKKDDKESSSGRGQRSSKGVKKNA